MKPNREDVRGWLIDHQHDQIMLRYSGVKDGERVKKYFSEYMYPTYDKRAAYAERNEFFRKIVNVYTSGRINRYLGPFGGLFKPQVEHVEKIEDLPGYLRMAVRLYDLTNELDERMVDYLCPRCESAEDLNDENYRDAFRKCSTCEERNSQVEMIVGLGEYARKIIEKGGVTDFLIETCPTIPFFSRNRFMRGVNEAIKMVKTAYRAFKSHRDSLEELRDTTLKIERDYLDAMMGRGKKKKFKGSKV